LAPNTDALDQQWLFVASHGYRAIAHDRRGHRRSSQLWDGNDMDTYADYLAIFIDTLDLLEAVLVGHSTGGGEVNRSIGRYGTSRIEKAVLVGAVPPLILKTEANPDGLPIESFDQLRAGVSGDRSQFYTDLSVPFCGAKRNTWLKNVGTSYSERGASFNGGICEVLHSLNSSFGTELVGMKCVRGCVVHCEIGALISQMFTATEARAYMSQRNRCHIL
jgi:pimeloyl-ACP methyl ester carboxylesterase